MVYPLSSETADDDRTSRQEQNRRRADYLHLGKVEKLNVDGDGEGVPQAVNMSEFLERYIFNCRPIVHTPTKIRVNFSADRPPTIMINGFMLRATFNVISDAHAGGAGTVYILAVRTEDSTTFTIVLRLTPTEGEDERLIGDVFWTGTQFDTNLVNSYELEGFGLRHTDEEIVKAWVSFSGATGVILNHHDVTSVVKNGAGQYTVTWDTDFVDTTYVVVGTAYQISAVLINVGIDVGSLSASSCDVNCRNHSGTQLDPTSVFLIAIGDQE